MNRVWWEVTYYETENIIEAIKKQQYKIDEIINPNSRHTLLHEAIATENTELFDFLIS